ncbi:uncharacterized protein LOC143251502 [Tachypleus tridentatus]|uniref:uncharacterized protein LOC143251502 n=1 Tax=Tachypleus tridentatus TaxID=6853 RepID=UPI003FD3687E
MCKAYKVYFGMPVRDQDKPWVFYLKALQKTLEGWCRGEKRTMKFVIPRIWREPSDLSSNCYFCMMDTFKRQAGKNASAVMYSNLPLSITTVPHCPEFPVLTPPKKK